MDTWVTRSHSKLSLCNIALWHIKRVEVHFLFEYYETVTGKNFPKNQKDT